MLKNLSVIFFIGFMTTVCGGLLFALADFVQINEPYIYFKLSDLADFILISYSFVFAICSYFFLVKITDHMKQKKKKKKKKNASSSFRSFLLWTGGIQLLFIPFVYLAMHHSITITEKEILVSPFWDLDQKHYSWEAVDFIELSYEYDEGEYYGSYVMYLVDGEDWDLWDIDSEVFSQLMIVDELAKSKQVEKEIWNQPYLSEIPDWADEGNHTEEQLKTLFEIYE
ncbi:hypothetical protein [Bacillus sp. FJAT-52991]|uniref:DUF5673 domain-containing protein n=1 Tax=Bacillus kandeliae TaxID=3129297 RepID=A0ABZ2N556_9BACI